MNENISGNTTLLIQDLRECRNNIATRGGTISTTAGFSEVAEAILELPSSNITGVIVDDSISFRKQVPAKSADFCYLNSIGAMSYVSETLTATRGGDGLYYLTYTRPPDYVPGQDGSGTYDIYSPVCPLGFLVPEPGQVSDDGVTISGYFSLQPSDENIPVDDVPVTPYIPAFARNVSIDKRMFPENYFLGLRNAKPTSVRSYRADGTLLAEYTLPTAITDNISRGFDETLFDEFSFVTGEAVRKLGEGEVTSVTYSMSNSYRSAFTSTDLPAELHSARSATDITYIKMPIFASGVSIGQINSNTNWSDVVTIYAGKISLYPQRDLFGTTATLFNDSLQASPLPYVAELENFVTTTIATDFDPLLQVEAGGYLEFVNEYGYAVPSTVTFQTIFNA